MQVKLSKQEKKIIRKIAGIQLASLWAILKGECEEDIVTYCLIHNFERERLDNLVKANIQAFMEVKEDPNQFLYLNDENLSMVKHILMNEIDGEQWDIPKKKIWVKLNLNESVSFHLN